MGATAFHPPCRTRAQGCSKSVKCPLSLPLKTGSSNKQLGQGRVDILSGRNIYANSVKEWEFDISGERRRRKQCGAFVWVIAWNKKRRISGQREDVVAWSRTSSSLRARVAAITRLRGGQKRRDALRQKRIQRAARYLGVRRRAERWISIAPEGSCAYLGPGCAQRCRVRLFD